MKILLVIIIIFHGLIHLLGFLKAFDFAQIPALSIKTIILVSAAGTRFSGILWLVATILFLLTAISYIWDNKYWWIAGLAAVAISQILIILYWKDVKFGTIANVSILFPLIITLFTARFNRETVNQKEKLFNALPNTGSSVITASDVETLPSVVQQWLLKSGVVRKYKITRVELKQKGEMLTKPGGKWMPFFADQLFTLPIPAFEWEARIDMIPGISIHARDVFENGKDRMLIKPMAVITIADAQGKETDQGTLRVTSPKPAGSLQLRWNRIYNGKILMLLPPKLPCNNTGQRHQVCLPSAKPAISNSLQHSGITNKMEISPSKNG